MLIVNAILLLGLRPDSEPPAPLPPVPSPAQLAWHALEYCAFVHFNMNTFTGREWGDGTESESTFLPTALDCRQWAKVAKDAGMKGIILTAKHHDGFCLWPSKLTPHTVAGSPWKDGRGDVLRELSDACRESGLKFGVYLSPWDRNQPCYGDSDRYNDYFVAQLTEVLTQYGDVFEVWFDGACGEGPNGKKQVYDWPRFVATVRKLQPNAVIFSDAGPDVRWVGNERGFAGETCWSMLKRDLFYPGTPDSAPLTEGHEDGTHWVPAECDVSIRPGWYYHAEQDDQVKSVAQLMDIWYGSVGRNASLLLNLPVDRRGLVHENDVKRLMEFRAAREKAFAKDLARDGRTSHFNDRVDFPMPRTIDCVVLSEPIGSGQRVRKFHVAVEEATTGAFPTVATGTTIGRKRILRFEPRVTKSVQVMIDDSRASPMISAIEVYGPQE